MDANVAILWDKEVTWDADQPFVKDSGNEDYKVYTELGAEEGLIIYIGHYSWYEDGGLVKAWRYDRDSDEWVKEHDVPLDGVFDKFVYNEETRPLKDRIAEEVGIMDEPELERICKDKLETYELFPEYVPETRIATQENAEQMLEEYGRAVFKPRYGFAGEGVEVLDSIDAFEEPADPEKCVIQRFVEAGGVEAVGVEGPHDLRTVVINGELQDGNYVRVAEDGLISNISRGADMVYIETDDIPDTAMAIVDTVIDRFEEYQPAIFAVDIMFDTDGRPWMLELNSKPGTRYHNHAVKEKDKELPKIRAIIHTLALRFAEQAAVPQ